MSLAQRMAQAYPEVDAEVVEDMCAALQGDETALRRMLASMQADAVRAATPRRAHPPQNAAAAAGSSDALRLALWESEREALRDQQRRETELQNERLALQRSQEEYERQQRYAAAAARQQQQQQPPRLAKATVTSSVYHLLCPLNPNSVLTKVAFLSDHNVTMQDANYIRAPGDCGSWSLDSAAAAVVWSPYTLPNGQKAQVRIELRVGGEYAVVSQVPQGQQPFLPTGTRVRRVDRGPPYDMFLAAQPMQWAETQNPPQGSPRRQRPQPPALAPAPKPQPPPQAEPAAPKEKKDEKEKDKQGRGFLGGIASYLWGNASTSGGSSAGNGDAAATAPAAAAPSAPPVPAPPAVASPAPSAPPRQRTSPAPAARRASAATPPPERDQRPRRELQLSDLMPGVALTPEQERAEAAATAAEAVAKRAALEETRQRDVDAQERRERRFHDMLLKFGVDDAHAASPVGVDTTGPTAARRPTPPALPAAADFESIVQHFALMGDNDAPSAAPASTETSPRGAGEGRASPSAAEAQQQQQEQQEPPPPPQAHAKPSLEALLANMEAASTAGGGGGCAAAAPATTRGDATVHQDPAAAVDPGIDFGAGGAVPACGFNFGGGDGFNGPAAASQSSAAAAGRLQLDNLMLNFN